MLPFRNLLVEAKTLDSGLDCCLERPHSALDEVVFRRRCASAIQLTLAPWLTAVQMDFWERSFLSLGQCE